MVLGEPGDRIAEFVGEAGLLGDLGKHLRCRLVRLARPHQVEDAEFHCPISVLLVARSVGANNDTGQEAESNRPAAMREPWPYPPRTSSRGYSGIGIFGNFFMSPPSCTQG